MSLIERIKELKEEEAKALEAEKSKLEEHNAPEDEKEPAEEAEQEVEKEEEKEPEKVPEGPAVEPEEKPDSSAYARMRREAAANKRKADELEAQLAEERRAKASPQEGAEQTQPEIPYELEEMLMKHKMDKAEREFESIQERFRARTPDYDAVAQEYTAALAQSIKIQNPRMSNAMVIEKTKEQILLKASDYARQRLDPVEEMYHEAKELGFNGQRVRAEASAPEKEESPKPDMKKLAANRARSTGMATATGRSEGQLTPEAAHQMTTAEWYRLPKAQKDAVMNQLRVRS